MYDNKIRLSQDVLEKAEVIAQEWGLKNSRAAVEAVFRRYADEYLGRRAQRDQAVSIGAIASTASPSSAACDALNELDELLGL
ncbi:hypothetical protein JOY44_08575 [Phormidium sp. CLA17]|uniref:hypothetical protein n=1 Tax=Leptolyngbya sp. Cla-17 TaxID=2803751 RepID=UPI001490F447|nr:hypothetical protein [Leptolyngbya sp. Cla-17]MBM0741670.1 hypothetical protein [Leptolyngbya sp. Cla-17]